MCGGGGTGKVKAWDKLAYKIAYLAAFRPILNKMGFDQLRLVISAGAAMGRELSALWQIWGLNMIEVYGQTEAGGALIAGQKGTFPRPGDVGTAPDGWDVRLGDDGEILVKSCDMFEGWWRGDGETEKVLDAHGWLHTGDIGTWENGRLKIVDRARDIIVTSGGKTISPTYIESQLRASPYISEAVVYGDGKKYLTALIEIEFDSRFRLGGPAERRVYGLCQPHDQSDGREDDRSGGRRSEQEPGQSSNKSRHFASFQKYWIRRRRASQSRRRER